MCRRAGGKTIERPEEAGRAVVVGAEERGCGQGAWPPKAGTEAATGQTLGCSDGGVFRSGSQPVPVCPYAVNSLAEPQFSFLQNGRGYVLPRRVIQ